MQLLDVLLKMIIISAQAHIHRGCIELRINHECSESVWITHEVAQTMPDAKQIALFGPPRV